MHIFIESVKIISSPYLTRIPLSISLVLLHLHIDIFASLQIRLT